MVFQEFSKNTLKYFNDTAVWRFFVLPTAGVLDMNELEFTFWSDHSSL